MLYSEEAIIIRSMDYGESNLILTIFTRERGRVAIMVQGAKKMKSRFSGVSQLFTHGQFIYYKSKGMGSLSSGEVLNSNRKLREQLELTAYASYIAEMYDRLLGDEESSPFLYEQLKAGFSAMDEGKNPQLISHMFELKLLQYAGYAPELANCVSCGLNHPSSNANHCKFSGRLGGWLCDRCIHKDTGAPIISNHGIQLLRIFQNVDMRKLGKLEVKQETKLELKTLLRGYWDHYLDVKWKSRGFLDQLDKYSI